MTIFCLRQDFCLRQLSSITKIKYVDKTSKISKNLLMTKKPRLVADFTLGHTGGWGGGVSSKMIIGNFMVIKGLT